MQWAAEDTEETVHLQTEKYLWVDCAAWRNERFESWHKEEQILWEIWTGKGVLRKEGLFHLGKDVTYIDTWDEKKIFTENLFDK